MVKPRCGTIRAAGLPAYTPGVESVAPSIVDRELRPGQRLMTYYALSSLVLGPFFPLLLIPRWLRYRTLRYLFDDEAVSMRWGALQRRETVLSYERIQDLHVVSNPLERWLGLARIENKAAAVERDTVRHSWS